MVGYPKLEGLNPALRGTKKGENSRNILKSFASCGSSKVVEHPKLEGLNPTLSGTKKGENSRNI